MMNIKKIYLILLVGGFFLQSSSEAETILKDKFVFKINSEVFSILDLKEYNDQLENLFCVYTDSILYQIFKNDFKANKSVIFDIHKEFSVTQKQYFSKLKTFAKGLVYKRNYDVLVNSYLKNYFKLSLKKNKCSSSVLLESKEFNSKFYELIEYEIFLRSRFLPTDKQGKTTPGDYSRAVEGATNLLKSIDSQIEAEIFW